MRLELVSYFPGTRLFNSSNQLRTTAERLPSFIAFRELISQHVSKWSFRLLHRNTLLKLSKPVQDDIDASEVWAGLFACWQNHEEAFAIGRDIVGTTPVAKSDISRERHHLFAAKCEAVVK